MKKHYLFFLITVVCNIQINLAQNPSLVADINTQPAQVTLSQSSGLVVYNNRLYFSATDNAGAYIWSTDGTTAGTYRDLKPGIHSFSLPLVVDDFLYYFSGVSDTGAIQLWKTDGTQAGTLGLGSNAAYNLAELNGLVYFEGSDAEHGVELWRSDGTVPGTYLLKDILPGNTSSQPLLGSATVGNKLVFTADYDNVYVTDGTAAGTVFLMGDSIGGGTLINYLVSFQGSVYFLMNDETVGMSLWKTDGTASGTVLVKALNAGYASQLCVAGNRMFFISQELGSGGELWTSDGTTAGTKLVKDIRAGSSSSLDPYTEKLYPINDKVYFGANDGTHGKEPWISDGTAAGTQMIIDLVPGSASSGAATFVSLNNKVLFNAFSSVTTNNLYSTDGTAPGTVIVSGTNFSYDLKNVVHFKGKIYFLDDAVTYARLWYTDGTTAGTQQIEISTEGNLSSNPSTMVKLSSGNYVFTVQNGSTGKELWSTDGIDVGNGKLFPTSGTFSLDDLSLVTLNGAAYFNAVHNSSIELWKTNGTVAGTEKVKDIQLVFSRGTVVLNAVLYFVGSESSGLFSLWRTDGTEDGTYRVVQINNSEDDQVAQLVLCNNKLFFTAKKNGSGTELWTSDGTVAGTIMVADIVPGKGSSSIANLTSAFGKLYFSVKDSLTGYEPWISDGTAAGTHLLKDIRAGKKSSDPSRFTAAGSLVYFTADDNIHGNELWKTDGVNTSMVKDLAPGSTSAYADQLTALGDRIYFTLGNGILATTDGTSAGTDTVYQVPGVILSIDTVNSDLYFRQYLTEGQNQVLQLWRSDGTACRTQRIDFFPGVVNETANILLTDGNIIFLALNNEASATELWKYESFPIPTIEICNGYDDDCDGLIDEEGLTATITPSGNIIACDGENVTLTATAGEGFIYTWYWNGNPINGATTSSISSSTLAGMVQVVVTSPFGCADTSDATVVTRLPTPKATITPLGDLDICVTGSVVLKANAGNGYTYQWLLNNATISGATKKQYTATAEGNYKVIVTNTEGCSKTAKKITVVTSCKESMETLASNKVNAYPNPFHDAIHLDFSQVNWNSAQLEIRVTDLSGKILLQKTFSGREEIEVGNELPDGYYLLQVQDRDHREVIPILKSR